MALIGTILAALPSIAMWLLPKLVPALGDIADRYKRGEITREEFDAEVKTAITGAFSSIEKSHADSLASTFGAFQETMRASLLVKVVWAIVTLSQLVVLLWHQVGIPAFVFFVGRPWPSSGTTVEWAYLLLGACLGMAPLVLRAGPGGGPIDALKAMIGRLR